MKNVIVQLISIMIHADQLSNKAKGIKAIINQSKKKPLIEYGYMLPYYVNK